MDRMRGPLATAFKVYAIITQVRHHCPRIYFGLYIYPKLIKFNLINICYLVVFKIEKIYVAHIFIIVGIFIFI